MVWSDAVKPPKRQMFRLSEFFKNLLQEKEKQQQKKEEAALRLTVKVSAEVLSLPPKKPNVVRKQQQPSQMLSPGGKFSMTVGENLRIECGS